jgi:serine/threonine-protein kinase
MAENGAANYAVAGTGTLAYLAGEQEPPRSLVWVNRAGKEKWIDAPDRKYAVPRISPDGRRLVVEVRAQEDDLWTWDFAQGQIAKLTFGSAVDVSPVWSADGRRVLFASTRAAGQFNVYAQNADGTGSAERITTAVNAHPTSASRDGSIVFDQFGKSQAGIARLKAGGQTEPLIDDVVDERGGQISPDGRYIAYQSNESGHYEVYVRPYPNVGEGHWQVSTEGGTYPMWARSGTELFFLDAAFVMTAVPVTTGPDRFWSGKARPLFDARGYGSESGRAYDVSLDGSQFLMIKKNRTAASSLAAQGILIVVNWFEDVRSRLAQARR